MQDPDYVALAHSNLNVDNAYFWRDEAGTSGFEVLARKTERERERKQKGKRERERGREILGEKKTIITERQGRERAREETDCDKEKHNTAQTQKHRARRHETGKPTPESMHAKLAGERPPRYRLL